MTIWNDLARSGIFPCKNDDLEYEEDQHDGNIGIQKSFWFRCLKIYDNYKIFNVAVAVKNDGSHRVIIDRIEGPQEFDFATWIKKSEDGIREGMKKFLKLRGLIK